MLTDRQRDCIQAIEDITREKSGVGPSVREIASRINYKSPGWAWRVISDLENLGLVRRIAKRSRAIEIVNPVPMQAFIFDDKTKQLRPLNTGD